MELIVALLFLIVGLFLEIKYKIILYHSLRERMLIILIVFVVFVGWEFINRYVFQAWLYSGAGMIGWHIFGLPIELYLFYLTAPYFAFVVYELIHKKIDKR
jgi:hypothetical protein